MNHASAFGDAGDVHRFATNHRLRARELIDRVGSHDRLCDAIPGGKLTRFKLTCSGVDARNDAVHRKVFEDDARRKRQHLICVATQSGRNVRAGRSCVDQPKFTRRSVSNASVYN